MMSKRASPLATGSTETLSAPVDEVDASENDDVADRPLRADALRNRARILNAAEEVFALEGVGAPIDVVAERAQVGVGTLYRHFPTKEALFEAIVLERLQALLATARVYELD